MVWFQKTLSDNTKEKAAAAAEAYIERAQLVYRVLSFTPTLSPHEIALHWYSGAAAITKNATGAREPSEEISLGLGSVSREFFDSICQDLLQHVGKSPLILSMESKEMADLIVTGMNEQARDPARSEAVYRLIGPLVENSIRMAGCTVSMLVASLTEEEARKASEYAVNIAGNWKGLHPWERHKAAEWLARVDWSS